MDHVRNHPPPQKLILFSDSDLLELSIGRNQEDTITLYRKPFDCKLTVDIPTRNTEYYLLKNVPDG